MPSHPMDNIPVRPLRFTLDIAATPDPVWSRSCPDFAIFMNAIGIHVPWFERFLVRTMRAYRDEISDPGLLTDVRAIIGQESHHAFNFLNWTKAMANRYPGLERLDADARQYFERADTRSKQFRVGFTAGYETFTFLAGIIILDRFDELMGDADPVQRALWVWHQVEEVEHGAVAFDFYQALFGGHEWYRKAMVLFAFLHISLETFRAYRVMLAGEGFGFRRRLRAWRFFAGFAFDLFRTSLPVYARDYHPRQHPICNDHQNRIAVAWRQYHDRGSDTRFLDASAISHLKELAHAH